MQLQQRISCCKEYRCDLTKELDDKGIITKYGAWFSYNGNRIGQGRENAKQYLKEHPAEMEEITAKLREQIFGA